MKVVIAGGRDFTNSDAFHDWMGLVPAWLYITEVVSGGAVGVDALGEQYAGRYNLPLTVFPADWEKHKRAAGPIRNAQMAEYGDALIAFWDGKSRGTKNMIENMKKRDKHIVLIRYDLNEMYGLGV
jgi:hypothetical protein